MKHLLHFGTHYDRFVIPGIVFNLLLNCGYNLVGNYPGTNFVGRVKHQLQTVKRVVLETVFLVYIFFKPLIILGYSWIIRFIEDVIPNGNLFTNLLLVHLDIFLSTIVEIFWTLNCFINYVWNVVWIGITFSVCLNNFLNSLFLLMVRNVGQQAQPIWNTLLLRVWIICMVVVRFRVCFTNPVIVFEWYVFFSRFLVFCIFIIVNTVHIGFLYFVFLYLIFCFR